VVLAQLSANGSAKRKWFSLTQKLKTKRGPKPMPVPKLTLMPTLTAKP
jgi:hypothetical protein